MMTTFWICPMVRQRCSVGKVSGLLVTKGSWNRNRATSKLIRCLRQFSSFLSSSHSHRIGRSFMATMSVILWCQWSAWGRLPSVDAGILQVLAGQFYHGVADVDLAGDDVGNEAGTVLVREVDLAVYLFDC